MLDIYISALIIGFFGGAHCIGMCGGVVAMLTMSLSEKIRKSPAKVFLYHLNYNLGRIISYVLLGLILGYVGSIMSDMLKMTAMNKIFRIIIGIIIIMAGLYLAGFYNSFSFLEKLGSKLWVKIQPLTKKFIPVKTLKQAFIAGLLWGYIPCGLVYTALGLAIMNGSSIGGGFIMMFFGIGTLPSLLTIGGLSVKFSNLAKNPIMKKIAGISVIIMGITALYMPVMSFFVKLHH